MNAALVLLGQLRDKRIESYTSLRELCRHDIEGGDALFQPALGFLFLMGTIEYRPKVDAFEYVGPA